MRRRAIVTAAAMLAVTVLGIVGALHAAAQGGAVGSAVVEAVPSQAALRAIRALPRGHVLTPSDLNDPAAGGRLAGLRLTRALRAGARVNAADLAPPRLIQRNARVMITFTHGTMTLSDRGRALADAALGETIPVLNLSSRRTVEAVAIGPGRVSVGVE
ncbi:MAG: flagellar basal body P-ring formation chaperone FlgA [Pseudomonadota bacterium]